jgi:putative glutamine amidotransferase
MPARNLPLVGLPCCLRTIHETRVIHGVGDRYVQTVIDVAGCMPVLIPAVGAKLDDVCQMLDILDGLLLTGSGSNVEPDLYGGPPSKEGTLHDPARDATTLPLIREAIRRDLPILAICRGIQELNVALGGTLHQRVQELPGAVDHRYNKDTPEEKRGHEVVLTPGGFLAGLAGTTRVKVNSRHGQAIDRVAPRLRVEAVAPDGLIEAVTLPEARFVVGVQWHPEDQAKDSAFSRAIFDAFAAQCRATHSSIPGRARAA